MSNSKYILVDNKQECGEIEDRIINELINLENHLQVVHPQSAKLAMYQMLYNNKKHLFSKEIKDKFLERRNIENDKSKQEIEKSANILTELCNYDFKSLLLLNGYPKNNIK